MSEPTWISPATGMIYQTTETSTDRTTTDVHHRMVLAYPMASSGAKGALLIRERSSIGEMSRETDRMAK